MTDRVSKGGRPRVTPIEKWAYQRGYQRGASKHWPEPDWCPPNPPQEQVLALFVAAKDLRDAAFGVVSVIDCDTEPFIELQKQAHGMDAAFATVSRWLKGVK